MQRGFAFVMAIGLAVAFSFALSPAARAQPPAGMPPPPGPGEPGNPMALVMAPAVQVELKLTEAQKTKLYTLARTNGQRRGDVMQSMLLSGGQANPQVMMAAQENFRRETDKALGQVLDKKQQQRLKEISLRVEGPLSVVRPEIAERLNINDAQAQAIQRVMIELFQANRQMMMQARAQGAFGGGVSPDQVEAMRLSRSRLRNAAIDRIGQVLNRKQKDAFDNLLGAPFDLAKLHQADEAAPPDGKAKADEKPVAKEAEKDAPKADADDPPKPDAPKAPAKKKSRRDLIKENP